ncbi:hypothetical protein WMY93_010011 [Mugilogobius chulae]|uniref:Uncharacterized protein n=1 Tax=Mugilogobius chulae TaxID=88201 RepID=A0AAW0P5U8_9GOBI
MREGERKGKVKMRGGWKREKRGEEKETQKEREEREGLNMALEILPEADPAHTPLRLATPPDSKRPTSRCSLLREDFSPDPGLCEDLLGFKSPLTQLVFSGSEGSTTDVVGLKRGPSPGLTRTSRDKSGPESEQNADQDQGLNADQSRD